MLSPRRRRTYGCGVAICHPSELTTTSVSAPVSSCDFLRASWVPLVLRLKRLQTTLDPVQACELGAVLIRFEGLGAHVVVRGTVASRGIVVFRAPAMPPGEAHMSISLNGKDFTRVRIAAQADQSARKCAWVRWVQHVQRCHIAHPSRAGMHGVDMDEHHLFNTKFLQTNMRFLEMKSSANLARLMDFGKGTIKDAAREAARKPTTGAGAGTGADAGAGAGAGGNRSRSSSVESSPRRTPRRGFFHFFNRRGSDGSSVDLGLPTREEARALREYVDRPPTPPPLARFVFFPPPTVTGISPRVARGSGGTLITIHGKNFPATLVKQMNAGVETGAWVKFIPAPRGGVKAVLDMERELARQQAALRIANPVRRPRC